MSRALLTTVLRRQIIAHGGVRGSGFAATYVGCRCAGCQLKRQQLESIRRHNNDKPRSKNRNEYIY
jgi:hypothetical protein